MSSEYPRRHYDERALKVTEGVFRKVWPRLGKIGPYQPDYETFRIAVINRILDLVGQGMNDPDELTAGTMRHFSDWSHA